METACPTTGAAVSQRWHGDVDGDGSANEQLIHDDTTDATTFHVHELTINDAVYVDRPESSKPAWPGPGPGGPGARHDPGGGADRSLPPRVCAPALRPPGPDSLAAVTTLVLASASPARLRTLHNAGIHPVVVVSDVDEEAVVARYGVTDPADVALVLARAKAEDVAAHELPPGTGPDVVVLGCDSVLELDGVAYGKPADDEAAVGMWRRMRGRSGVLHTGHWLLDERAGGTGGTGATLGAVASTVVHFADLADTEIEEYVATGEPTCVAGAFTTDGLGGAFVRGIEGDHHTVVGVSLPLLRELLAELRIGWTSLWRVRPAAPHDGGR